MDKCSHDITVEFLGVTFHSILYYSRLYPASIFEARNKYSVIVYSSVHPEVNKYISLCLKNISELLQTGKLDRVDFVITNAANESLMKFVFEIGRTITNEGTDDAYLVQCEQNMRAFCLSLAAASDRFKNIPEDASFSIHLHTDESSAVALASNPDLEEFPFIEVNRTYDISSRIIPLRNVLFRGNEIEMYIEQ